MLLAGIKDCCGFLIKRVALNLGVFISKVGIILLMLWDCYEEQMGGWMWVLMNNLALFAHSE